MSRKAVAPWARAFAGSLIFALPMLMTMEMWRIGFYIAPLKLALLLSVSLPLLFALAVLSGFEPTKSWGDKIVDVFLAVFVATVMALLVMAMLGIILPGMSPREITGKIALQTFAGSIGALLAGSQFQADAPSADKSARTYPMSLLLMAIGAIFLGLNVAPTEEVILLSFIMSPWHEITMIVVSLGVLHGFVFLANFKGGPPVEPECGFWELLVRYTVAGYAIVLVISLYLLWTFGRLAGNGLGEIAGMCIVLGFPCTVGAAASRLIL